MAQRKHQARTRWARISEQLDWPASALHPLRSECVGEKLQAICKSSLSRNVKPIHLRYMFCGIPIYKLPQTPIEAMRDKDMPAKQYLTDLLVSGSYVPFAVSYHLGWKALKEAQGYKLAERRNTSPGARTNPNLVEPDKLKPELSHLNLNQARSVITYFRSDLCGHETLGTFAGMLRDHYSEGARYLEAKDVTPAIHDLARTLHEHFVSSKVQLGYSMNIDGKTSLRRGRDDLLPYEQIKAEYQSLNVMGSLWVIAAMHNDITGTDLAPLPMPKIDRIRHYEHTSDPCDAERFLSDVIARNLYMKAAAGVHEAWRALKAKQGWKYGIVTDMAAKTNRNMVDFDTLHTTSL